MVLQVGLAGVVGLPTEALAELLESEDGSGLMTPLTCPKCCMRETLMAESELFGMRIVLFTARVRNGVGHSPLLGESDRGSTASSLFPKLSS